MTRAAQTLESPAGTRLAATLRGIVGADGVRDDAATRALMAEDIWSAPDGDVALVVAPRSLDQLAAVMRAAHAEGVAVAPRGAGMSYTSSHVATSAGTLSLDLAAMDRVLDIDADDMTVTVEPGCTWAALSTELKPRGLRTPFWGPMSGLASTIGGGLSQLNAMLGAGHYGTSSESVVALTMVLADGSILRTGAAGKDRDHPFYRHYGPDLTGLFCGDSGTLGIKAAITLRLIRAPAFEDYASFSFPTGEAMLRALAEVARAGVASETCGFDPGLTRVRLKRMSLASDVKTLGAVIAKEKSLAKGLMSAAKVALGGRNFIDPTDYPLHLIAEGRSAAGVAADMAEMHRIAAAHGGHAIENTIAKVIRAVPFPPLNSMLGPEGEAWVPVHGMVNLSAAPTLFAALRALFAELAPSFEAHGIYTGYLFTSVSTNAITIEPVFYWPHRRRPIHEVHVEPGHLAKLPKLPPNPAATAIVADAKQRVVDLFASFGCGHFQIGRTYPYRDSRDEASRALLDAIKMAVDPKGQLNPGGLGFPGPMSATYRAIQLDRFAPSFREATRVVALPVADPGPGEIRVRNRCCGVNGIFDTQFALGKAGYMNGALPSFTGVEAAGTVEAVGAGVTGFAPGDAVAAMRFRSGYREVNIAPADQFARLPDASRASLAIASTGVAALLALEHAGQLRDGETVAVSAAAGGLGHFLVQLARLRGCTVVAICGGGDKAAFVRELGADRVIDYRAEDVAAVLADEYKDAIDVAVDTVGGGIFDALVANIAPHGRLVVSGAAIDMESGAPGPRVSLPIYYKAARIQAFQNGLVRDRWPGARARLFALQAAGALRVRCDAGFQGLDAVYDAIDHLTAGRSVGKVAVDL